MGTWNTGIFDDDLAMDIKADFEDALEEGMSVKKATEMILENYEGELEDDEEAPIVYFTLAALQIEKGKIVDKIKKKVLKYIELGQDLERWKDNDNDLIDRINVLKELKERLSQ